MQLIKVGERYLNADAIVDYRPIHDGAAFMLFCVSGDTIQVANADQARALRLYLERMATDLDGQARALEDVIRLARELRDEFGMAEWPDADRAQDMYSSLIETYYTPLVAALETIDGGAW